MYLSTAFVCLTVGLVLGLILGWISRGWWVRMFGVRPRIVYEEYRPRRGSWWWPW